jgi:cytochrome c-type biogenesis protein CcsB
MKIRYLNNVTHGLTSWGAVLALSLALTAFGPGLPALAVESAVLLSIPDDFAASLDLEAIRLAAVQDDGRVKTVDSLAREKLKYVNSKVARAGDPVLLYLDMLMAPEHYRDLRLIFVKKPWVRRDIIEGVRALLAPPLRTGVVSDAELERFEEEGLLAPRFLDHPVVQQVTSELQRDLLRTNREMDEIHRARNIADPRALMFMLAVIPPPGGTELDRWLPLSAVLGSAAPRDDVHGAMASQAPGVPGMAPDLSASLSAGWNELRMAWGARDATRANTALVSLATDLEKVEPSLYPSLERRSWESWYYRSHKMTWVWLFYFFALPFLLIAVVYGVKWARWAGLFLFASGAVAHTASIVIRWILAERIPNANMFEAVVASAWFGCVVGLILEIVLRKKPLRNLPALAASVYAMIALMVGYFSPVTLNSDITTVMPVLDRTIWLYIHTNIVIASYALIFFGSVTALLYVIGRVINGIRTREKRTDWSGRTGLARSLDGATMIFLQLAFISLWSGTALGAIWADVSWGRPWGWDPKEVFALNTWIVLLILVHVRLMVKEKALYTAILALISCAVMLFNWIAVNFVVVGLHSYA